MAHGPKPRRGNRLSTAAALCALFGAAAVAPVVVAAPALAASNLLTNGGFEAGNLSGWSCSSLDSVVSSPVHSGSHALAGAANNSDNAQCTQAVSVQPSTAYTLTGWVEGNYVYIGDSGTGTNDTNNWTPSASTWQQLSTTFTTGASTTSVTVYVHGWYGQGTYFADDLSLTGPAGGGGGGSAPGAPSGLTVTGTTSSSVSLSWTAPSSGGAPSGYNVYENGTKVDSPTSTSDTIGGLAASTTYTFTVTAFNSVGESPQSSSVQATTQSSGGGGGGGGGGNLLTNGGFEAGNLSGWSCSSLDSVVSSPVHSGSHALAGAANNSDNAECDQT
ncbi:MAG TPA: carbohydrate binding domain-containing protein, partial [Streptosporangiaceae bacterium]|nr:carbohydrate binding domain-containing protein [Streptosporangiaceae bacterium]